MVLKNQTKLFVKLLLSLMSLIFLSVSFFMLYRMVSGISMGELLASINSVSPLRLAVAGMVCFANYGVMVGYDSLGLRYAGSKLPFRKIAIASFVGNTLNNNIGLSAIVGSTIKFSFYSHWGEKSGTIARAIGFYTVGYWMGFAVLTSLSLWYYFPTVSCVTPSLLVRRVLSVGLIIPVILFVIMLFQKRCKLISLGKFHLEIPSFTHGISILIIGILDWALTGILFYLLMPSAPFSQLFKFISIYSMSHLAGMLSQVPGGITVFESAAIMMNQGGVNSTLIAALLLFRLFFFIGPFIFGLIGFIVFEFKTGSKLVKHILSRAVRTVNQ